MALLAPGPYWLDSSEFAAAAFGLGVAHPPGHPLAALLGKAFALLPLGSIALRVGLAQATCGALAAALVTLLGAEVARRTGAAIRGNQGQGGDPLVEALGGAAAGLGFGWSHAAAMQAVRPEVYALHAALAAAALLALARFDAGGDPRRLLVAALALGLGLANHHLLTGLLGIAAVLYVASQHARLRPVGGARLLGLAVVAVAIALCAYAYLPVRALHRPLVDWGAPSTVGRFVWTVSARAFHKSLRRADLGGAPEVVLALVRELGVLAPLVAVGAWTALRLAPIRRLAALLVGGALLAAAAPALVGFDRDNPDAYGYLEPAVALLLALVPAGPAALAALLRGRVLSRFAALAVVLVAGGAGAARLPALSLAGFHGTAAVASALLDDAPPRALVVTSYFQTVFPVWYLRGVEGRRPDVDHVHRHFLSWPGYRDDVVAVRPELAPVLGDHDLATGPLIDLASRRRVLLEYDLDLDPVLALRLSPGSLADELSTPPPAAASVSARAARLAAELDLGEPETRRFVLWRAVLDAHRDCARGRSSEAQAAIARARALLGGTPDPDLEELARRCGG